MSKVVVVALGVVAAAFAAPAFSALLDRYEGDDERRSGVGPPPASEGVGQQTHEQGDREVGTQAGLPRLLHRRSRVQAVANPPLHSGEQRHRRRRERGQADSDPARLRVRSADKRAQSLRCHIGREDEEARGDQLLRPTLRRG